jgi:hypothetical protein
MLVGNLVGSGEKKERGKMQVDQKTKLNPKPCDFCGVIIVYTNCTKLAFPCGEIWSYIEFKKARYIDVTCGECHETTVVRNPKFTQYKN